MRFTRLLLTCLLGAAVFVPPALAEDAPRNTKPFTRFKILLSSAIINDTLPFDVPFILWGDAPEGTTAGSLPPTSVTLQIVEAPDDATDCTTVTSGPDVRTLRSEARRWTATDYADRGITTVPADIDTSQRRQFEFLVRPLKPKRMYCFLFQTEPGRAISDAEVAALQATLFPAYQSFLLDAGRVSTATEEGAERLRQSLLQRLLAAVPIRGFRPVAGNVFDPAATSTEVRATFVGMAMDVFLQHNQALDSSARADQVDPIAETAFARLMSNLKSLVPVTDAQRSDIAFFTGLTAQQRTNVLLGVSPGAALQPLGQVWQVVPGFMSQDADDPCPVGVPGPVAARCQELQGTRDRLNRLQPLAGAAPVATDITQVFDALGESKTELFILQAAVNQRDEVISKHVNQLRGTVPEAFRFVSTTLGSLATRRQWYLSADAGIAVAPALEEVFPYVGTNIYFRPVNMEAEPGPFLSRFSAMVGFTWTNNLVKPGETESLYAEDVMLLLGAGLRVTDFIRFNGGALVLKALDPNPLIHNTRLRLTPWIAMSADVDVAGLFGRMFGGDEVPPAIGAGTPK